MTTAEILKAARGLIDTPEKWTQGAWSRSRGEHYTPYCYCSAGALARVATGVPNPTSSQFFALESSIALLALEAWMGGDIVEFNDTHGHADVMAAFDRAIAAEEAKAA